MRSKSLAIVAVFVVLMWSFAGLGSAIQEEKIELSDNSEKVTAEIVSVQSTEITNTRPTVHKITSTYEYEYDGEVYQMNSTSSVREHTSMRHRTYSSEDGVRSFDEVVESRMDSLENKEVTLYINPNNPEDATKTNIENGISTTLFSLSILVWIPLMTWFVRSFRQNVAN